MTQIDESTRIRGYPGDAPRRKEVLRFKTYEYDVPFNYPNVEVKRHWHGGEKHGLELFPIKQTDINQQSLMPADSIVIREDEPIVEVAVIGSACTPPGYVTLEADLAEGERRGDETIRALPVRFRADYLWGMHLRGDLLKEGPEVTYRHLPVAGMSCAIFQIPKATTVRIKGGSTIPGWDEDNYPDDIHYSFRVIRVTVVDRDGGVAP
jgi:hypothetical protein